MIEFILGKIVQVCGTITFVMFCLCMIYYMPKYFEEWYLEMVNRHNHYRRRRDVHYEWDLLKLKRDKSHYDELWERADKELAYEVFGDIGND